MTDTNTVEIETIKPLGEFEAKVTVDVDYTIDDAAAAHPVAMGCRAIALYYAGDDAGLLWEAGDTLDATVAAAACAWLAADLGDDAIAAICAAHTFRKRIAAEKAAATPAETPDNPAAADDGPIYLATPYTSPHADLMQARFDAACAIAADLCRRGKVVYSPIAHTVPICKAGRLPSDFGPWRKTDGAMIRMIAAARGKMVVVKMPGWKASAGIAAEVEIAKRYGMPVEYMTSPPGLDVDLAETTRTAAPKPDPSKSWAQ